MDQRTVGQIFVEYEVALKEILDQAKVKTNSGTNARTIWWIRDRAKQALEIKP
jgi:hypothetical protein